MKTITEVKELIAKDYGYKNYFEALVKNFDGNYDGFLVSVSIRWGNELLTEASEKASAYISYGGCNYEGEKEAFAIVDKDSILKVGSYPFGHPQFDM